MNYGQLKTLISSLSHRTDLTSLYDNFVELVEARIGRELMAIENEYTEEVTTTAQVYDLSGLTKTFSKMRSIYASINGDRCALPFYSKAQLDFLTSGISYTPYGYTIESNKLEIRPTNGNQTTTLTYWFKPTTLVGADGNTNEILTTFPHLYVNGLLSEIAAYERDTESEAEYRAKFQTELNDINERAEDARYSGSSPAAIGQLA